MNRRDVLRAGATLSVAGVAGCSAPRGGPDFAESFEDFEWEVGVSETEAVGGDRSLRI